MPSGITNTNPNEITTSGTADPYKSSTYAASPNDKNTLTTTSFIKLLAAQLANQDMSNPMSNSEMMAQMTQMAMVQSMTAMNDAITTSTAVTSQTYAAGLVGQELTVAVTETGENGVDEPVGVKYGKVESVSLIGGTPIIRLEGDDQDYPLSYVLGIGKIDNPYKEETKPEDPEDPKEPGAEGDNPPETDGPETV